MEVCCHGFMAVIKEGGKLFVISLPRRKDSCIPQHGVYSKHETRAINGEYARF